MSYALAFKKLSILVPVWKENVNSPLHNEAKEACDKEMWENDQLKWVGWHSKTQVNVVTVSFIKII